MEERARELREQAMKKTLAAAWADGRSYRQDMADVRWLEEEASRLEQEAQQGCSAGGNP
jgi:hypothetical protein